jgi:peptidoglycan/LPS O-acetylase OafA/YrhL
VLVLGRFVKTDVALMVHATLYTLAYVSNWVNALSLSSWPSPMDHFWSLAVEEQFYLVWPAIVIGALAVCRPRTFFVFVVLGAAMLSVWRWTLWTTHAEFGRVYFATDARADPLLLGCALAVALHEWELRTTRATRTAAWCAVATIAIVCLTTRGDYATIDVTWNHSVIGAATAIMMFEVLLAPHRLLSRLLSAGWLTWIGRRSYGLYLYHYPIFFIATRFFPSHHVLAAVVALLASLGVAAASFKYVEQPALRLKNRFSLSALHAATEVNVASPS